MGSYWGTKKLRRQGESQRSISRLGSRSLLRTGHSHDRSAEQGGCPRDSRAVAEKRPFFCYFAHYAPHTPIEPDERFAPKYRAAGLDNIEAAYASLLEGMDKSVGDLLALLDELGVADNTLVVFTSDNGGVSHEYRSMAPPHTHNTPLSSGKGSHHEGGIRVPLLVRWPGVTTAASINHTPVMIFDWFPTLLQAGGADIPADIDGAQPGPAAPWPA